MLLLAFALLASVCFLANSERIESLHPQPASTVKLRYRDRLLQIFDGMHSLSSSSVTHYFSNMLQALMTFKSDLNKRLPRYVSLEILNPVYVNCPALRSAMVNEVVNP